MRGRLLFRLLSSDWRSGELTLLVAALVLAVATVAAITLFVDRLQGALLSESSTFLAADRVITAAQPITPDMRRRADEAKVEYTDTMSFMSMVFAGEQNQLASVKAVAGGYPMKGQLRIADQPFGVGRKTTRLPNPGEVWLDSRLFPVLGISIGDVVAVGAVDLKVSATLIEEPARGGSMVDLAPRVLMRLDDVAATRVVQPGSRIFYRWLLRGEEPALSSLRESLEPELKQGYRWLSVKESSPSIGSALDRAESFLLLGGLLAVLLAGVAVALSANRYADRHSDHVAILKTLGATPRQIQFGALCLLAIIGLVSVSLGLVMGGLLHLVILEVLHSMLLVDLPPPGLKPWVVGSVTGFVCLFSFAMPPLLRLGSISPLRVIRRDLKGTPIARRVSYVTGAAGAMGLLIWYSGDLLLTLWALSGIVGICLIFAILAVGLLRSGRLVGMQAGNFWRLGLAGLQRRHGESVAQILIFGLAIMLLLILVLMRTSLLEEWRSELPADTPNHFVMNISSDEVAQVRLLLAENARYEGVLYPMIRGRVVQVNGQPSRQWEDAHRMADAPVPQLEAERNLSWAPDLPENNQVMKGSWWSKEETEHLISVEESYAESAGLGLDDELVFDIGGIQVSGRISSIRRVEWDSMQPNFFMLFSPAMMEKFPAMYMTSFYLPVDRKAFLNRFLAKFPTITVIEVDQIIAQVQSIIARVTQAVELVMLLVLGSGCMVLVASIQASRDARLKEHALLRSLGATRHLITGSLLVEFITLGFFAGIVATLGAETTVVLLQQEIFNLPVTLHPWLWLAGPLLGTLVVALVGMAGTRRLINSPPVLVLRDLG